jgi:hypothetical protein
LSYKITFQDCLTKSGPIEPGTPLHKKQKETAPTLGFGKYRDKTPEWVQQNDEGYWDWAMENVPGFEKKFG